MTVSPGDPAAKLEEILEKIKIKVSKMTTPTCEVLVASIFEFWPMNITNFCKKV